MKRNKPVVCSNTFVLHFAEIDFVPAPCVTHHRPPSEDRSYVESGPFAWIPYSLLEPYVRADIDRSRKYPLGRAYLPADSQTDWLWPTWLAGLRDTVKQNALPWGPTGQPPTQEESSR